ncbi:MAG: flagellar biosynthetic protein FliO [Nannocystaceae bacterium]|nr:flagellar biosynthetic protein FliO [Nannocystaceae bacterium]
MKSRIILAAVTSVFLGGLFVPTVASADENEADVAAEPPPVRLYDTGDHVAIVVRGANADVENIRWRWGKMHVPTDVGPRKIFAKSFTDSTVKRVALIGGESPRVMVLLRHGDRIAKKLTEATEIEAVDGGFRILIPRKETLMPPAPAAPVPEAAPVQALPAQDVASPAEIAAAGVVAVQDMAAAANLVPQAPTPEVTAEVTGEVAAQDMPPLPVMAEPADDDALTEGVATASTQSSDAALMGVMTSLLMLVACGGVLLWVKRRKTPGTGDTTFEVLGNQALGGKSRLILLGLGNRRMLLAVSEAGTSLVDKWTDGAELEVAPVAASGVAKPRIDRGASSPLSALEFDAPRGDMAIAAEPAWINDLRGETAANDDGESADAESSAVTGLLELRRRGRSRAGRDGQPSGADEDRWVEALAAQLRAGDA